MDVRKFLLVIIIIICIIVVILIISKTFLIYYEDTGTNLLFDYFRIWKGNLLAKIAWAKCVVMGGKYCDFNL